MFLHPEVIIGDGIIEADMSPFVDRLTMLVGITLAVEPVDGHKGPDRRPVPVQGL